MFQLNETQIERDSLIASLADTGAGALVTFEGWVRDHNEGKPVASLEYQAYAALAKKEGEKILSEAKEKYNLRQVICSHRIGHLQLGEIAVWIGAVAHHRDDAFKASRYVIDQIKLRLPIWKKEHYLDGKSDWVFCRGHGTHVHFHEDDYYSKQTKIIAQDKLKAARVFVVGAGGLGCTALTSLAMAGVGHIKIAEFDKISITNIHRQPLYSPEDVGEKKVKIAKKKLSALNPFIRVSELDVRIGADNVELLIQDNDLILDCTDNLETKYLLHDACLKHKIPLVSASIYQFEGQIRTFDPSQDYGCLRCANPVTPDDAKIGNCNDYGVLGVNVAAFGSLQASEALLFLLNRKNTTSAHTFYFNLTNLQQIKIKNTKLDECVYCRGDFSIAADNLEIDATAIMAEEFELIDIREKDDSYLQDWQQSGKNVIVYCHRGIRSKRLVKQQRELGFTHFYSLKGGACSL